MTPEGKIQTSIVRYGKFRGFWVLRFEIMSMAGFPDLMLLGHGRSAFIEVKRPGKKATKLQAKRLEQLKSYGIPAIWCDNINDAKEFIDGVIRSK